MNNILSMLKPYAPNEGKTLVGQTADRQVPADRRYLSNDEGRPWTVGTCPGDWRGTCPAFTVDNAFGSGASYAFVSSGIYVFHGSGPAERALAIGSRLPVPLADILDVQAGTEYGQPVYILTTQVRGGVTGVIYRTTDQGRTWQRLADPAAG
jgi:hypothetical protein